MQVSKRTSVVVGAAALVMVVSAGVTAQAVGGKGSGQSRATRATPAISSVSTFAAGSRGDVVQGLAAWDIPVDPGLYDITDRIVLLLQPTDPHATSASVICGVADLNTLGTPDSKIYLAESTTVSTGNGSPAAMSGAATLRIRKSASPGFVCFSPDASMQLFQPLTASFTSVHERTWTTAPPVPLRRAQVEKLFGR